MTVKETADILEEIELAVEEGEEQEIDLESSFITTIYETVTWSTDWTIETIFNQIKRKNIDLSPAFQRRDAWNQSKKSRFIESLFLGLPIPQLVLAEDINNKGKFIVVDGKQRLTTIYQFLNNEIKVKDTYLDNINNKTFDEIQSSSEKDADFFQNQPMRSVILKNWKSESLLYSIFYRLNSGSLPLSPQELRSALKPGPVMEAIARYAETSQGIQRIFNNKQPDPRMKDVELLLRYVSFKMFANEYDGNYKEFLDTTCDYFNKDWSGHKSHLEQMFVAFEESVETATSVFGDNVFNRYNMAKWENRFSRAVFDIQSFYFSESEINKLVLSNPKPIVDSFTELCDTNPHFLKSITSNTNNLQNTSARFVLFGRELERVTGITGIVPPDLKKIYEEKYAQPR